jgi:GNAT superfamily N-acetyltransferase
MLKKSKVSEDCMTTDPTQSAIQCRAADPADLEFIYQCLRESLSDAGLEKYFSLTGPLLEKALFSEESYAECVIAEVNKQPIGLMVFSIIHHNFPVFIQPGMYVHEFFVVRDYRLHGIARKLGSHLITLANERKCSRIEGFVPREGNATNFFFKTFRNLQKVENMDYLRLMIAPQA